MTPLLPSSTKSGAIALRDDHHAMMDELLLEMPGVKGGKMFGHPAYKAGKKAFVFVGGDGIGIKLPANRVQELLNSGNSAIAPFEPVDGTVWKEWVTIDHDDSEDYRQYTDLFQESLEFVAG